MPAGPTSPQGRLTTLDVLRGFALLGVLVVNVYQSYGVRLTPLDATVGHWLALLAEGSFYPAFSLLFGLGFALQLGRGTPIPRFRRRLMGLLAIGLLHGFFVWHGDILASYALVGLALPSLSRMSPPRLLLLAAGAYGLTILFFFVTVDLVPAAQGSSQLFATGGYLDILEWRAVRYAGSLLDGLILFGGQLLALFALGLQLGRGNLAARLGNPRWLGRALALCLLAALPILLLAAPQERPGRVIYVLEYLVASPLLGFAYLAALALALCSSLGKRLFSPFAAVGRMALSNYLAQSVVGTLLFYGYGLGFYGRSGIAANLLLSLAFFAAQMLFSTLWLRFFRFGPLEWLWRSLTYARVQPLVRSPDA